MIELLGFLGQYICFFILHVCGGGSFPKPLTEKQERECLEKSANGDIAARNMLVEHNLRLVAHIIRNITEHKANRMTLYQSAQSV